MFASDFSAVGNTHQLLWHLFEAEVGIRAGMSPATQRQVLVGSYPRLREEVLSRRGESFRLHQGCRSAEVSYEEDAVLLSKLYGPFNSYEPDEVLRRHVYPLVGAAIEERPVFSSMAGDALASHIELWGPGVGDRILKDLPRFGLDSLVPELRPVVAFAVAPRRCA